MIPLHLHILKMCIVEKLQLILHTILKEIISDPLNDYLNANPQAAEAYKKK